MLFFFFNDTATTEIYTLSLHDALPICKIRDDRNHALRDVTTTWYKTWFPRVREANGRHVARAPQDFVDSQPRSEEHTSELQSRSDLVCRLLLEKKTKTYVTRRQSLPKL